MRTIIFVCTGNTCRSPMAEAIATQWLRGRGEDEQGRDVFVASAGVFAEEGVPTSAETIAALERIGIEYTGEAKLLTAEMVRNADLVLCMTDAHVAAIEQLVGAADAAGKVRRLDDEEDLEDPIGRGQAAYDRIAQQLQALIPRRLREVLVS